MTQKIVLSMQSRSAVNAITAEAQSKGHHCINKNT
jgi:hypothetical protein